MNINSKKSYKIGFLLSLFFTIIPFYIVKYSFFEKRILYVMVIFFAIIQIYVHLIYFLHLNQISDKIWKVISLIFTIFILSILVLGSIWIMTHLHHNSMN